MSGKWVNSWVWRSANTALKGKKNTARKQGGGGNIEKWKAASLTVPDTGWKQAFRVIVTKDVESKNRSISSYETKACYNRCIVVAVSISTRFKKWGFIISDYQGCVPCHGWLILRCHCPGLSPSPGRVQCSSPVGPRWTGHPRGCQYPKGLVHMFALRLVSDLGSGGCFPLAQGSEHLYPRPECCGKPRSCCQVSPASVRLGFIILTFVLEDPLSCKSKRHFYFQLLHDSYYSSALTSAINNNRIVNYCSF